MRRSFICVAVVLLVAGGFHGASAQTGTPAPAASSAPATPKPSRTKVTVEKLREIVERVEAGMRKPVASEQGGSLNASRGFIACSGSQ